MYFRLLSRVNDRQAKFESVRSTRESLLATIAWATLLFIIALPNGFASRIGSINLRNSATSLQIRKAWGGGDAGSLLDPAITWAHGHQLDISSQFWIVHLWSPGMSIVEIPLIWLENLGIPLFWSLLSLTVLLWSAVFYLAWKFGSVLIGRVTLTFVSLLFLFSWDFRYIFRDDLFYTEGLGYGLLFLGLLIASWMVLNPENRRKRLLAVSAGISIGVSIWIRHVSDTGLMIYLGLCSVLMVWGLTFSKHVREGRRVIKVSKKRNVAKSSKMNTKSEVRIREERDSHRRALGALPYLTLSAFVGFLVTLPWRIISPLVFHGSPGFMSSANSGVFYNVWVQSNSPEAKYGIPYGMNWACNIDPQTCATLNLDAHSQVNRSVLMFDAIKAVLFHPFAYMTNRSSFAYKNWIPGGFHWSLNSQMIVASLLGLAALLVAYLYFRVRDKRKRLLALIWMPFLTMQLAQLAIIHYEPRYFIPVRFLIVGFALTLVALRPEKVRD